MEIQKTGTLIAARRTELGLTQKQLAERLHLSDRTISRWERGVGFPDISLLEPLADTLGLSVVELLRGERLPQEEQISLVSEHSLRKTFRTLGLRLKRFKRIFIISTVILITLLLLWLLLLLSPFKTYTAENREVSLTEATALDPTCIITREDFDLIRQMTSDPELLALLQNALNTGEHLEASADITAHYRELFLIGIEHPQFFSIQAYPFGSLSVIYRLDDHSWSLFADSDGTIKKYSVIYEFGDEYSLPNSSSISNTDNLAFQYHGPRRLDRFGTLTMLLEKLFSSSYRP